MLSSAFRVRLPMRLHAERLRRLCAPTSQSGFGTSSGIKFISPKFYDDLRHVNGFPRSSERRQSIGELLMVHCSMARREYRAFISYSRRDEALARSATALLEMGISG